MNLLKLKLELRRSLISCFLAALVLVPSSALASVYGSGNYGNCTYGQGCPSSGSSQPAAAASPAVPSQILLNDFPEYFSSAGKDLNVTADQVILFDTSANGQTTRHTITIKTVGTDFVEIVIDSNSSTDRLAIGQNEQFDVTTDGKNDIQITLKSISGTTALMNFKALNQPVATPKAAPATISPNHHLSWWLWLVLFGFLLVLGIWFWFILWKRRHHSDEVVKTNDQS